MLKRTDTEIWIEATALLAAQSKLHRPLSRKYQFDGWLWKKKKNIPSHLPSLVDYYEQKINSLQEFIAEQDAERNRAKNWVERTWLAYTQSKKRYRIELEYCQRGLALAKMQQAYQQKDWGRVIELEKQQPKKYVPEISQRWLSAQSKKTITPDTPFWSRLFRKRGSSMPSAQEEKLHRQLKSLSVEAFIAVGDKGRDEGEIDARVATLGKRHLERAQTQTSSLSMKMKLSLVYFNWKQRHAVGWNRLLDLVRQKRQLDAYQELALMGIDELRTAKNEHQLRDVFLQAQCQLNATILNQFSQKTFDLELNIEASKLYKNAQKKLTDAYANQHQILTKKKITSTERAVLANGVVNVYQLISSTKTQETELMRIINFYRSQLVSSLQTTSFSLNQIDEATARLSLMVAMGQQKTGQTQVSVELNNLLDTLNKASPALSRVKDLMAACKEAAKTLTAYSLMFEEQKPIFFNRYLAAMTKVREEFADILTSHELENALGVSLEGILKSHETALKNELSAQTPEIDGELKYNIRLPEDIAPSEVVWLYKMVRSEIEIMVQRDRMQVYIQEYMLQHSKRSENGFAEMHADLLADPALEVLQQKFNKAINLHLQVHHSDKVKLNTSISEYCQNNSICSSKRMTEVKAEFKSYLRLDGLAEQPVEAPLPPRRGRFRIPEPVIISQFEQEYALCQTRPELFKLGISHKLSLIDLQQYRADEYQDKLEHEIPVRIEREKALDAKLQAEIEVILQKAAQMSAEAEQVRAEKLKLRAEKEQLIEETARIRTEKEQSIERTTQLRAEKEAIQREIEHLRALCTARGIRSDAEELARVGIFAQQPTGVAQEQAPLLDKTIQNQHQ